MVLRAAQQHACGQRALQRCMMRMLGKDMHDQLDQQDMHDQLDQQVTSMIFAASIHTLTIARQYY